jgi:hypothetical protein
VRPANPRTPARATWRSFIGAYAVASCDASGGVEVYLGVNLQDTVTV